MYHEKKVEDLPSGALHGKKRKRKERTKKKKKEYNLQPGSCTSTPAWGPKMGKNSHDIQVSDKLSLHSLVDKGGLTNTTFIHMFAFSSEV